MIPEILNYTYREGEHMALSLMLQNKDVDTLALKCQPHFIFNETCRQIFQLCVNYSTGAGQGEMHIQAVQDALRAMNRYDTGKAQYLESIRAMNYLQFPDTQYVINRLRDMSMRRSLIITLDDKLAEAKDFNTGIENLITNTEEAVSAIDRMDRGKLEVITPDMLCARRYQGIKERYRTRGVYTGWELLDKRLAVGFAPGKFSVIAGRTSMGKSFFKTNLIRNMCVRGVGVMNVCPEQGFDSEHDRFDAIETKTHLNAIVKLREWPANDTRFAMLKKSTEKMATWHYTNVPNRRLSVSQIRTAIRKVKSQGTRVDVVFIDLFDRLDDVNVAKDRAGTISVKLGEIERIAEEEKVHVCLLVQINRVVESKKNRRPAMSELRDSGNFEQDADLILLLYREGYYDDTIEDNILEVKIEKQRDGIRNLWFQFMIIDKQTLEITPMREKEVISDKE